MPIHVRMKLVWNESATNHGDRNTAPSSDVIRDAARGKMTRSALAVRADDDQVGVLGSGEPENLRYGVARQDRRLSARDSGALRMLRRRCGQDVRFAQPFVNGGKGCPGMVRCFFVQRVFVDDMAESQPAPVGRSEPRR